MKKSCCVLAWLAALPLIALAGPAGDEFVPTTLAELQAAVEDVRLEHDVPAVGIALVGPGGPVWVDALGKADLEKDLDANADSLFRIGSVSKMFVALAVLQLVEQGRLSLDDRVADLAPEIGFRNRWAETDPVRVVHLLEHTTGWDDLHLPEYAHSDPTPATLREGLDFHPHSRVSRWKPGSRMAYCNSGPPVAAWIVQKLTGRDFEQYVHDEFFDPIGMDTATYRLDEGFEEHGVTLYANGNRPQDYWHIIMRPSGAINASPRDMASLVQFFLERGRVPGRRLLSESSLRRMERAESTPGARAGLEVGYGLHNYSSRHEHWVYREHNGGVNGGLAEFAYLPEAGVGHAIMINSDSVAAFREISRLVRAWETRELARPAVENERPLSAANRELAGYYQPINPRQAMGYFIERITGVQKIAIDGDRVVREPVLDGEATVYYPVDDARYRHAETGRRTRWPGRCFTPVRPCCSRCPASSCTAVSLSPRPGPHCFSAAWRFSRSGACGGCSAGSRPGPRSESASGRCWPPYRWSLSSCCCSSGSWIRSDCSAHRPRSRWEFCWPRSASPCSRCSGCIAPGRRVAWR